MKKFAEILLVFLLIFTLCGCFENEKNDLSRSRLAEIIESKNIGGIGTFYTSDPSSEHYLSLEMLSVLFSTDGNTAAFEGLASRAAFFLKNPAGGEIIAIEVQDVSRAEEIEKMMLLRAKKERGATVSRDGCLLFLTWLP